MFFGIGMTEIQNLLIDWYYHHKRNLPWRLIRDPYSIWVSEVIMQQTRIDQGLTYYLRFLRKFPDVTRLARASEEEVLTVWKGLGYYSRARNMHHSAMQVMEKFDGQFPSSYHDLLTLKGIGKYTAAAISSICSHEPYPVVDGNVIRVYSRLFGVHEPSGSSISVKKIYKIAESILLRSDPGDFNQAVMEFGALHCKPANPLCKDCMLTEHCYAFKNNLQDTLPVKKKEVVKRDRFFNYLCIITPDAEILMKRRTEDDIWKNLWDLPVVESDHLLSVMEMKGDEILPAYSVNGYDIQPGTYDFKHLLTHQNIFARYFIVNTHMAYPGLNRDALRLVSEPISSGMPVSRLTERFLQLPGILKQLL